MSLFVVKHQHEAETSPAGHPEMGPMLVQHVSKENAAGYGLEIQGEGVIDGGHTFYMIVESDDQSNVERFMTPFTQVGSVEILPASHCEQVVARARC